VEGSLAVTDFLVAVRKKVAPDWAYNLIFSQNNKIVWGEERKTLFEYGEAFQRVVHLQSTYGAQGRVFFTSSSLNEPDQTSKGLGKQGNNQIERKNHNCPCRKKNNARKHPWKPKKCRKVVLALEGESGIFTKVTSEIVEHIVKRLKEPQWQLLREYLIKNGLNPQKGGKPGSNETSQNKNIIAAVLCPINDPSSQIPYIANYYIAGDFVAIVFEQILLKAGNLNLTSIKAYSTGWKPAHNAHEFK
jgi:hypothetical protein